MEQVLEAALERIPEPSPTEESKDGEKKEEKPSMASN